jgi:hypothetical protein
MHRILLSDAHLEDIKREARDLLHDLRRRDAAAFGRFQSYDPLAGLLEPRLDDALYIVAREYGYSSWQKLRERLDSRSSTGTTYLHLRSHR